MALAPVVAFAEGLAGPARARVERLGLPVLGAPDLARLAEGGVVAVHAFGAAAAETVLPVAKIVGFRLIVSLEGGVPSRALMEGAERLLVPSRAAAKALDAARCPLGKVIVAPYGVDLRPMRPRRAVPRGPLRVVTAPGSAPGADLAAAAGRAGVELEFVTPSAGDLLETIDRGDLFFWWPEGEVSLLPAFLLEALASGVCVIAPRTGVVPEAITSGVTGLLHRHGDALGLLRVLLRAARDPALRIALGAAGRVVAEIDYDEARTCRRIAELHAGAIEPR